jgi:hypothetical protein
LIQNYGLLRRGEQHDLLKVVYDLQIHRKSPIDMSPNVSRGKLRYGPVKARPVHKDGNPVKALYLIRIHTCPGYPGTDGMKARKCRAEFEQTRADTSGSG